MLPNHWPESWESLDLTEYRSNMLHGREAYEWIVKSQPCWRRCESVALGGAKVQRGLGRGSPDD